MTRTVGGNWNMQPASLNTACGKGFSSDTSSRSNPRDALVLVYVNDVEKLQIYLVILQVDSKYGSLKY